MIRRGASNPKSKGRDPKQTRISKIQLLKTSRPRNVVIFALAMVLLVLAAAFIFRRSKSVDDELVQDFMVPVNISSRSDPSSPIEQLAEKSNPLADDWHTEVLNLAATRQLNTISMLLEHPENITIEKISEIVADDFTCQSLRPPTPEHVYADNALTVRSSGVLAEPASNDSPHQGADGMVEALRYLANVLEDGNEVHAKLKLWQIETSDRFFTTRSLFQASGRSNDRGVQLNGHWLCRWQYPPRNATDAPRLLWIGLEKQFEQITFSREPGVVFADCTESALSTNDSYHAQQLRGIDYWVPRVPRIGAKMSLFGFHGLAVGDVNGDGLEDLFSCEAGGLPNRLYVQEADGTLTDVSARSGVDWLDATPSALLIDLDNDGDQDLVAVTLHSVRFLENDGRGRFTLKSGYSAVKDPYSICAADYDDDGDLDLYLCGNLADDPHGQRMPSPVPYHDANNGGRNALLRNKGNLRFEDVTRQVGLDANNFRYSFAASWEDYDNDGDLDLYVANDFGRNNLYRNDRGRFTDVAADAGVEDTASGMSISWGDYNRDGNMDAYVANMFSAAGSRVTYQRRFTSARAERTVARMQRMVRGNTLFANSGDGNFLDVSEAVEVTRGRWAWASKFADFNNDGWQDLIVANGYISAENTDDL